MDHTLKDLEEHSRLNWSYYELQSRVTKIAELKPEWASRSGKRGKWLVSDPGVAALIRMRESEESGMSVQAAIERVIQETSQPEEVKVEKPDIDVDGLKKELREKTEQIRRLEVERDRLIDMLDRLITPALAPQQRQSRHWWQFWRS